MLHNEVSNGMLSQLRNVSAKIGLINLLPKLRCSNMKNLLYHVTADLIRKKNRNSVVAKSKRNKKVIFDPLLSDFHRRLNYGENDPISKHVWDQ